MASEPLIDLSSIDLGTVVADKPRLLSVLQQRGRFEMVDAICHLDLEEGLIVGYKDCTEEDWWVPDHVPGRPLFPGALMIECAAQICTFHFSHVREDLEGAFVGFGGLDGTRFRGKVEPGDRFVVVGKTKRLRKTMFVYAAQGFVGDQLVFESDIRGVVV